MFGINFLNVSSLSHGHSCRNLIDTSNVAPIQLFYKRNRQLFHIPPQFSILNKFGKLCATNGLISAISKVRTLVANKDWCASRNVVSIIKQPGCFLTACAKALGPDFTSISLQPVG